MIFETEGYEMLLALTLRCGAVTVMRQQAKGFACAKTLPTDNDTSLNRGKVMNAGAIPM